MLFCFHLQGWRQLPKSGVAQFPMQLEPSHRAHFHEGSKTAQFILDTHTYICIIFKVYLPIIQSILCTNVYMHTAVPAAMVYYVVHNINFYNEKNRTHGFQPGTLTYHFRDHMGSITGSLLFSSNHQFISVQIHQIAIKVDIN